MTPPHQADDRRDEAAATASTLVSPTASSGLRRVWSGRRLTTRLLAVYAAAFGIAMVVVLLVATALFGQSLLSGVDASLNEEVLEFQHRASVRPAGQALETFVVDYLKGRQLLLGEFIIVTVKGAPDVGTPGSEAIEGTSTVQSWLARAPTRSVVVTDGAAGNSYRLLGSPITIGDSQVGLFIVGRNLDTTAGELRTVQLLVIAEAAFALFVALVGGRLVLGRVLTAVRRTSETADRISRERLDLRLGDGGSGDEVGMLARSFNRMLDRLDAAFRSQRQLLADVSHQIRTPLTVIRGHLEVLQRGGYRDRAEVADTVSLVLDETAHAGLLIDRLLLLGRAFDADSMDFEIVALPSFLSEIMDAAQVLGARSWVLGEAPECTVLMDRTKMRSAILNLIENSVKATRPGDTIRVEGILRDGLIIAVRDTGKGMTGAQLEQAFQRFRSGPEADHGTGLGLAIVKAVVEAHGGRVTIESAPGAGCTVRIFLPMDTVQVMASAPVGVASR